MMMPIKAAMPKPKPRPRPTRFELDPLSSSVGALFCSLEEDPEEGFV
jgi:hypothetical protein